MEHALTKIRDAIPEQPTSATRAEGYEAVRYNALTHGVLSQCTVLPHEDAGAFTELLTEFINEHQPQGITEHHLVEELAGIVWRKRRLLLAEGARLNEGLHAAVRDAENTFVSVTVPLR